MELLTRRPLWNRRVRFAAAERYRARTASAAPELGPFLCALSGMKEAAHRGALFLWR
jgi:hypothetical protein